MNKRILGGGSAAVIGLAGVLAYAQAVPSGAIPPRLLPYVGHLDLDGSPVTGQVALKVCLVTSATTSCDAATWAEEFPNADVAGGKFSLVLGQQTAIPDSTFQTDTLYIRAMVGATVAQGEPTYVQLSGAQRVLSVPYAVNINQASDLRLDGPLHNGSVVPTGKQLGIYNETANDPIRLVTSGGPVTVSLSGNPANGYSPSDAYSMLSVGAGGVTLGDNSPAIRQITTCRHTGNDFIPYPAGNKYIAFTADRCSRNSLPYGTCFAVLGKTDDCGGGVSWRAVPPGQDGRMPSGGVTWWNQADCSPTHHDVEATFFCTY